MMKYILSLSLILLLSTGFAQTGEKLVLSLEKAQELAVQNNYNLKNALLDVKNAEYQVDEIKSMGLPQISGSGSFSNSYKIPTTILPGEIVGAPAGTTVAVQFGVPFNMTGTVTMNQLLFDGTFFLGLKAASEFVNVSKLLTSKSEIDVKEGVLKAYYMALIANDNIGQLESSLKNIQKLKDETRAMYEAGFAEKLDVDRMVLSASNLEISINNLKSQAELSKKLLLNSMGLEVNQEVQLTSSLPKFTNTNFIENYGLEFSTGNRIEYKLLEQQQKLNELDLKRWKMGYFPSLYGSVNYGTSTFANDGSFGDLGNDWYPQGMVSLSLSVPIFDGFNKKAKMNQVRVSISKTDNSIAQLTNGINLEVSQARTVYSSAFRSLELQQKSQELAESIYNTTSIKFKEGVGSSFEMITAESDLTNAKTNYLNALYDLSVAKINLDKALGNL
ncbi:MAG: hypothetical protein COA58_16095 [Bacteroidetes bacterium]|nr:MAG: hypothetical protein COA58_16095 [Bacteroidota bacterium]